jgi:hypothetical protein
LLIVILLLLTENVHGDRLKPSELI